MGWRRPGDKPLSEPMMVCLLTHICVTWPQWVNRLGLGKTVTKKERNIPILIKILKFVLLMLCQHWFRLWLGTEQATNHCLKQFYPLHWCICAALGETLIPGYRSTFCVHDCFGFFFLAKRFEFRTIELKYIPVCIIAWGLVDANNQGLQDSVCASDANSMSVFPRNGGDSARSKCLWGRFNLRRTGDAYAWIGCNFFLYINLWTAM